MTSAALHAEALESGHPCDCHACAPELYRGAMLSPDELAIYLAAVEETKALWLTNPRDRSLYALNFTCYYGKLAAHFEAVAEGGSR